MTGTPSSRSPTLTQAPGKAFGQIITVAHQAECEPVRPDGGCSLNGRRPAFGRVVQELGNRQVKLGAAMRHFEHNLDMIGSVAAHDTVRHGANVQLNTIMMKDNLQELVPIAHLAHQWGASVN